MGIQYSIVVPIYGDGYLAHALCAEVDDSSRDDSLDGLLKSRASYHGE